MVNLMQLRHNKRKQADKTYGRKLPRLRDVDIDMVPADNAEDDVAGLLIAAVTGSSLSSKTASPQSGECDTQLC